MKGPDVPTEHPVRDDQDLVNCENPIRAEGRDRDEAWRDGDRSRLVAPRAAQSRRSTPVVVRWEGPRYPPVIDCRSAGREGRRDKAAVESHGYSLRTRGDRG